jgi:hypothetical protein
MCLCLFYTGQNAGNKCTVFFSIDQRAVARLKSPTELHGFWQIAQIATSGASVKSEKICGNLWGKKSAC